MSVIYTLASVQCLSQKKVGWNNPLDARRASPVSEIACVCMCLCLEQTGENAEFC